MAAPRVVPAPLEGFWSSSRFLVRPWRLGRAFFSAFIYRCKVPLSTTSCYLSFIPRLKHTAVTTFWPLCFLILIFSLYFESFLLCSCFVFYVLFITVLLSHSSP